VKKAEVPSVQGLLRRAGEVKDHKTSVCHFTAVESIRDGRLGAVFLGGGEGI